MNEVKNVFIKKSYFDHDGNTVRCIDYDGSIKDRINMYEVRKNNSKIKYILCANRAKDNDELYNEKIIDNIKYDENDNVCSWYNTDVDTFTERYRFAADGKISREFEYVYDENNNKLILNDKKYRYERFGNTTITTRTYSHYNVEGEIDRLEIDVERKEDGSKSYNVTIIDQYFNNGTLVKSDYYEDVYYDDFIQQRILNGIVDCTSVIDIDQATGRVKGYITKYNKETNADIEKKVEYKYDNNGVAVEIFEEKFSNVANEKTGIPEIKTIRTYQYFPINDENKFENIFKDEEIKENEEVSVYTKFDQFKYTDTEEA